ncbi:DUF6221 family protein [Streptomyces massasporeus]|uniref:DUF6221 family protein n=1 Tax=Streptomyces massasporeus TaxID=67324 RepID=UPI00367CB741
MPDLHGWITQQIDYVAQTASAVEDRSAPWDGQWMADGNSAVRTVNGHVLFYRHGADPLKTGLADHVATHDPAAVLRRCEADRRILARHRLDPDAVWYEAAMCHGCGTEGEMAYPVTENLNDCPELLDLAYAHGLTDEVLAGLDRPQEGERPERTGPSLIPDALAEAFGSSMLAALTTRIIAANTPSPTERAIKILEPELKKIPGYVPQPEEQP